MESISELRRICQDPVIAENGFYVKLVVRKVSIYVTWIFLNSPISANQVSLLMILLGVAGGFYFALGGYINGLIGVLFLQLFLVFDCVDGEVARYKNQSSLKGKYLDLIANDITHVSMFSGLTFGMLNSNYNVPRPFLLYDNIVLICGLGAIISPLLYKIAVYYANEVCGKLIVLSDSLLTNKKGVPLKPFLRSILDPTNIINIVCICALLDLLPFILIGYGVIFPLSWILSTILRFKNI